MKTDKKRPAAGKQTFLKVTDETELMKFLQDQLKDKSRNTIKSLLAHHQVYVDYKITTQFNHPLEIGQQVIVNWGKVQQISPKKGLKIVFEDPFIIVIEKQPGLLSIATDKEKERTVFRILSDQARKLNPKSWIFVVHRLDREASGLMIFAKTKEIQQVLLGALVQGDLQRIYVAAVQGPVALDNGTITSWLKENKAYTVYSSTVPDDGQEAVTGYQVLKKNNKYSLLEITPETERKNQIRVHMKDLGHPVLGDKKYGAEHNPIKRLALHAHVLAFRHPVTGENLRFEIPIPGKFSRLFRK
jgi:23S rRNA pseudouridine1911/1915/1917 synthase